jgi:ABC-type branched-subunit amino acid transport system permease subunit
MLAFNFKLRPYTMAGLSLEFVYGYGGLTNTANNLFYNAADLCYYIAAVGVVFDRHSHRQHFFHGAALQPQAHGILC